MKLQELKSATHYQWRNLYRRESALVRDGDFQAEIRQNFGDLRCRETWEAALCHFLARSIHDCRLDGSTIVIGLCPQEGDRYYPYRERIFDEFLTHPDSLELLRNGLEQIFGESDYCTEEERNDAKGVFELVQGQSARGRIERGTVEFVRQLAPS